jgi:hypothetical protein
MNEHIPKNAITIGMRLYKLLLTFIIAKHISSITINYISRLIILRLKPISLFLLIREPSILKLAITILNNKIVVIQ